MTGSPDGSDSPRKLSLPIEARTQAPFPSSRGVRRNSFENASSPSTQPWSGPLRVEFVLGAKPVLQVVAGFVAACQINLVRALADLIERRLSLDDLLGCCERRGRHLRWF